MKPALDGTGRMSKRQHETAPNDDTKGDKLVMVLTTRDLT